MCNTMAFEIRESRGNLRIANGIAILRQGQGVPPGLSSATDIFNRAYEAPIEKKQGIHRQDLCNGSHITV